MAGIGGVVLPTLTVVEGTGYSSPTLGGVLWTVVLVAAFALAVGVVLKIAVEVLVHVGLLDDGRRLSYDAATVWGLALTLGYFLVYHLDYPDVRVVLLFAGGTVVTWPLLQVTVRQIGCKRLDVDGPALLRRHVVKGSLGLVAVAVAYVFAHIPVLRWLVLGVPAAVAVGFLLTGGSNILRRYTPSTGRAALPSHYAGLIQRTNPTSRTNCPECGAENDPHATVCADCAANLATAGRQSGQTNVNAHLKR